MAAKKAPKKPAAKPAAKVSVDDPRHPLYSPLTIDGNKKK